MRRSRVSGNRPRVSVFHTIVRSIFLRQQREAKSPTEVYVDMHGGDPPKPADDYVDPIKRIAFYESLENLKYDAELPPIPLSSDEEPLGDYDDKFGEFLFKVLNV